MDLTADMGFLWFFAHLLLFHRAFASEGEFCASVVVCVCVRHKQHMEEMGVGFRDPAA